MSIQDQINRILWDRRLITFPDELDRPDSLEYVIIRDFTLEDRNNYLFVKDLEENRARREGVPTEGELMENAREGGYWGKEEDEIIAQADDHIAFLEAEFENKKKFKSRQNIIKLQIQDAKAKKTWALNKIAEIKQHSAEYLAHEIATFQMLRRVALRPDGSPLIPDDNTFLLFKKEYMTFLFYLIQEMMSEGMLDTTSLREIARSTEWRLTWCLSRENLPALFGRSIGDLTINHRMLIYWSRVYDSAFESTEPPDSETIKNDDLFDDWLANRDIGRTHKDSSTSRHQEQGQVLDGEFIEKCICGAKAKNAGKGLGERMPHASNCQFGTWHAFTPQEKEERARRTYGRNSKNIRQILDKEQEKVLKAGVAEEQDLKNTKTRQVLGMPTKVISVKK